MRGWTRTGIFVGGTWIITWLFWIGGAHTPQTFLAAVVVCTGMSLVAGCVLDAWDNR